MRLPIHKGGMVPLDNHYRRLLIQFSPGASICVELARQVSEREWSRFCSRLLGNLERRERSLVQGVHEHGAKTPTDYQSLGRSVGSSWRQKLKEFSMEVALFLSRCSLLPMFRRGLELESCIQTLFPS